MKQLNLFKLEDEYSKKDTTFQGGKGEIFHDWYPYLEGYSSKFVKNIQEKY